MYAPRSRHWRASSGPPVKQWMIVRSGTPSASSTSKVSGQAPREWITKREIEFLRPRDLASEHFLLHVVIGEWL